MMCADYSAHIRTQFIAHRIVPGTMRFHPLQFSAQSCAFAIFSTIVRVHATGVSYRGTGHADKMQPSIRIPTPLAERSLK
jgi:hypothetical protein